jgi:hypothetical protein
MHALENDENWLKKRVTLFSRPVVESNIEYLEAQNWLKSINLWDQQRIELKNWGIERWELLVIQCYFAIFENVSRKSFFRIFHTTKKKSPASATLKLYKKLFKIYFYHYYFWFFLFCSSNNIASYINARLPFFYFKFCSAIHLLFILPPNILLLFFDFSNFDQQFTYF